MEHATKKRMYVALVSAMPLFLIGDIATAQRALPSRPQGPCDIYAAANNSCVAAHSTTRALYAAYAGPLYQVMRQSDGKTLNIGVVPAGVEPGGYADSASQDRFCANTYCWITTIYDQSPKHNDLTQAPRGGFSGPAMGGFNNLPMADAAPVTIMGHKVYGVFIAPGMGLRQNDAKGTAVDDQAEGQYWVINGAHYNSGCCFDYGNAEIDSRDDGNGTMETTYYGNATGWYRGARQGPWIMTDQENNLVGCVNGDGSKVCANLPSIDWRFATAIAKGEPHHWTSMGGDAQRGALSVMFDGPRIDHTYDPMRKQGAILLGNGGDNSVGSQGTFYEGAMTAAGTFPTDATDQLVQANVVAAKYDVPRLSLAPPSAGAAPPGLQTFSPGSSQDTTLTFTNTSGTLAAGVKFSIAVPKQWAAVATAPLPDSVAPGASVSVTFKVTSGPAAYNGDLVGHVSWTANGRAQSETTTEKVRNVSPIKINEFRIGDGSTTNSTNSFIELYNAASGSVDISNWTLTEHQTQQAPFSTVKIPAGTKLAAHGFYLLGLSTSGLAIPARAGDATIHVRSTTGLSAGDTIEIDTGSKRETRKVQRIGTAASGGTTVWQPLPEGPVITMPVGSTNVPVTGLAGFAVGEKAGIGYGATYPTVAKAMEKYEIVTITAVGKPGTQAFLGVDATAGETNIKVTSVANITAGDQIRLDIDSVGHGVETVTVSRVGTQATRTALVADASAGATSVKVRNVNGFVLGDRLTIGTPVNQETVTISAVGAEIDFTPPLARTHLSREEAVAHGTGLDLAAPLRFRHSANLPFSARGTGITFQPATAFAHSSNEAVQALGTGIQLDKPLAQAHDMEAPVRDIAATTAGYQGAQPPDQWFGGPTLSPNAGSIVLRNAGGLVVDSLNYGLLVDPWAAEGYQGVSGTGQSGCRVPVPGAGRGGALVVQPHRSWGRFPDGADTDSNCADFQTQPATVLSARSDTGATNIKVTGVADFAAGQEILIDAGASLETAVIATVGTAGATAASSAINSGATSIRVTGAAGFTPGQAIIVDVGASQEAAVIASVGGRGGAGTEITVSAPLKSAHAVGAPVSGSGITLTRPLTREHMTGAQVASDVPTPGAANRYRRFLGGGFQ